MCPDKWRAPWLPQSPWDHDNDNVLTAPVEEVRKATDDPLVHAVLDWLTLPTDE